MAADAVVTSRSGVSIHGQARAEPFCSVRPRWTWAPISRPTGDLAIAHGGMDVADMELRHRLSGRANGPSCRCDTVAVHVAAMLADIGGADGLAGRCGGQNADHRPPAGEDRRNGSGHPRPGQFRHRLVHQAAHQAHVGLDHGEAIRVEADAQHLDDERVAGLGARETRTGPVAGLVLGKRSEKSGAVVMTSSGLCSRPPRALCVSTISSHGAVTSSRGVAAGSMA